MADAPMTNDHAVQVHIEITTSMVMNAILSLANGGKLDLASWAFSPEEIRAVGSQLEAVTVENVRDRMPPPGTDPRYSAWQRSEAATSLLGRVTELHQRLTWKYGKEPSPPEPFEWICEQ